MDPETQTALYFLLIGGGAGLSIGAVGVVIVCAYLHDRRLKRRTKIIYVTGSLKFRDEMTAIAWQLQQQGYVVIMSHPFGDLRWIW